MVNDFVAIKWRDSVTSSCDWEFMKDMEPLTPATCVSVGVLIDDSKSYKTICQTVADDAMFSRLTIPTSAIEYIKVLGVKNKDSN